MFSTRFPGVHLRRGPLVLGVLLTLSACASGGSVGLNQAELSREASLQRQMALEENLASRRRIEEVSFRLMTAAAGFCGDRHGAAYGFTVANRYSFGDGMAEAASAAFGLDSAVRVLSVIGDSPAHEAGLVEGDVIARINGQPVVPGGKSSETVRRAMVKAGFGGLDLNIGGANPRRVRVELVAACDYAIEMLNSENINAYADGKRIRVTKGMMRFAQDETDLAMVVSHELAHNIMGHAGTFSSMFYDKKSRESDADYVGLYIMARGGFEIEKAAGFWRRMAAAFPRMIESSSSHPLMPARFVAIRKTTEEIRHRESLGLPLVPQRIEAIAASQPERPES